MFRFFWSRSASVWTAYLYVFLGAMLLIFPGITGTVFCWFLAGGSLIYAAGRLFYYVSCRKKGCSSLKDLILGFSFFGFTLFCCFFPLTVLSILPMVLGIILLLDGVGKLPLLIAALQDRSPLTAALAISVLVPMFLGFLIAANPFDTAKTVIMFFGTALVADGVCDLGTAIYARRMPRNF